MRSCPTHEHEGARNRSTADTNQQLLVQGQFRSWNIDKRCSEDHHVSAHREIERGRTSRLVAAIANACGPPKHQRHLTTSQAVRKQCSAKQASALKPTTRTMARSTAAGVRRRFIRSSVGGGGRASARSGALLPLTSATGRQHSDQCWRAGRREPWPSRHPLKPPFSRGHRCRPTVRSLRFRTVCVM